MPSANPPDLNLPTVIVLAAGRGSRFTASGGQVHKLQAAFRGGTVLSNTVAAVVASGLPYHVVTPNAAQPNAGMGDSIARGVAATFGASGWLVLPADLPCILPATLQTMAHGLLVQRLCDTVSNDTSNSASKNAATVGDRGVVLQPFVAVNGQTQAAHPVGFSQGCRDLLLALAGSTDDAGARSVVQHYKALGRWQALTLSDVGAVQDVDMLDDLAKLK